MKMAAPTSMKLAFLNQKQVFIKIYRSSPSCSRSSSLFVGFSKTVVTFVSKSGHYSNATEFLNFFQPNHHIEILIYSKGKEVIGHFISSNNLIFILAGIMRFTH